MNEKEKELMERYIYEVICRVPKNQRKEIQMELEELIGDMYDAKSQDKGMNEILKELGEPEEFAKQYRDESKYLISPSYFDDYSWLMKIVWGCILLSNIVSFFVQTVIGSNNIEKTFSDTISNLVLGCIFSFGIITIIFAFMERQKVKVDFKRAWTSDKKLIEWTPLQLPPVPNKKALISRGDCIASIIAIIVIGVLFIIFPTFVGMGIHVNSGKEFAVISPFNLEYWHIILPLILLSIGIELANEIFKLITGKYTKKVMLSEIICSVIQIILSVILLKAIPFFNPNFVTMLEQQSGTKIQSGFDLLSYWNTGLFTNILLFIIIGITILEVGTVVYKTVKYGE